MLELQTILARLTVRNRAVAAMFWFDGLRTKAIGRRFGMSERAVEQMLYRIRRVIREAGVEPPRRTAHRRIHVAQLSACSQAA